MFFDAGRQLLSCQYVKQKPFGPCGGPCEVFIPDIMKTWGPDVPKVTPTGLDASIYNNASECKPTVSKQTNTQNFATAKEPVMPYKGSNYTFCDEMQIMPETADVLPPRLTSDNIDNSW